MILGVDLSSNNPVFNFALAASQGCRLAYIKEGGENIPEYVSGSYAPRVDAAHAAGWPTGSYWITGGHTPDEAAAFFAAHLEHFGPADFIVLDNEKLDSGNTYSDAEAAEWVRAVLVHVGGSASRILHYGSKSFMESHAWPQLLATGCSFLIADYNGTPLQNHVPSTIPASRVVGHQYADNGNIGGASPVDMNAFVDSFLSTITTAGLGSTQIGPFMALTDGEQAEILDRIRQLSNADFAGGPSMADGGKSISESLAEIHAILAQPIVRAGVKNSQIQELADVKTLELTLTAQVAALQHAIATIATGQGADPVAIQAAAKAGADEALSNLKLEAVPAAPAS